MGILQRAQSSLTVVELRGLGLPRDQGEDILDAMLCNDDLVQIKSLSLQKNPLWWDIQGQSRCEAKLKDVIAANQQTLTELKLQQYRPTLVND